ncbi:heparan-alpha-glucosaminide N-acetyltransferase domain-containing protein [Nitrosomonas sp.]|uniref:heparan-alpha-glucosaminide N-acetyltransferase domain-containing protein n=1 Tax=Nitrosomonas sp. TaxID=42353 RepID=UPI0025CFDE03|nr:heparan-alpha-glucosaminide N-acetyltransferase domain-containing protein [Nitrosomonas sp.]
MIQLDKNAQRIAAIDWLRGIVMILMALDHTSWFFNTNRIFADSVLLYESGDLFATDQFLTRWITHICAPTFVFLAGTSIAISNIQRREQGVRIPSLTVNCCSVALLLPSLICAYSHWLLISLYCKCSMPSASA